MAEEMIGVLSDREIYINDGGILKIVCPFCGSLQNPRRSGYEDAQDAAEDAAGQCDCEEAREWRMREADKPYMKPFCAESQPANVEIAACKFCGQTQPVPKELLSERGLSAREYVTRICKCSTARAYQSTLEAERNRADALQKAYESIEDMFSAEGSEENRDRGMVRGMLVELSALVYDSRIKKATLQITSGIAAVISKSSSGALKIEKKCKSSESAEI